MKNILVILESIDIEDSSASKVNVALIYNLKKNGYNVKVLHYTRKNIQLGEEIECISIPEIKFSFNYILSRAQRVFQRVTKLNLSNFFQNIFGFSFTFFNDCNSILKSINEHYKNEDLVLTLSMGGSFRPHYAVLKIPRLYKKWIAYVHDPYPFHYYPRPYNWVEAGYKIKETFFREVSEKAKYSAFPSLLLKEWMGSYFPNFLKTGIIIPHQSIKRVDDLNISERLPDYIDKNKFNLVHAGNLMSKRDPRGLINAYNKFLKNNIQAKNNSKLLFLGPASYHKKYLLSKISNNIFWSNGNVKYSTVINIQNNASVNIILEAKSEISPFLPGKFPNCILANKPILLLSPYYSEVKRLLGDTYPYISEIDDEDLIYNKIETLYKKWLQDKNASLNRIDLNNYIGTKYLKKIINSI